MAPPSAAEHLLSASNPFMRRSGRWADLADCQSDEARVTSEQAHAWLVNSMHRPVRLLGTPGKSRQDPRHGHRTQGSAPSHSPHAGRMRIRFLSGTVLSFDRIEYPMENSSSDLIIWKAACGIRIGRRSRSASHFSARIRQNPDPAIGLKHDLRRGSV